MALRETLFAVALVLASAGVALAQSPVAPVPADPPATPYPPAPYQAPPPAPPPATYPAEQPAPPPVTYPAPQPATPQAPPPATYPAPQPAPPPAPPPVTYPAPQPATPQAPPPASYPAPQPAPQPAPPVAYPPAPPAEPAPAPAPAPKQRRFAFGFQLSMGDMDVSTNANYAAELRGAAVFARYRVNQRWEAELGLGKTNATLTNRGVRELHPLSASVLYHLLSFGKLDGYLRGGLGTAKETYRNAGTSSEFENFHAHVGAGLEYRVRDDIGISAEARGYILSRSIEGAAAIDGTGTEFGLAAAYHF